MVGLVCRMEEPAQERGLSVIDASLVKLEVDIERVDAEIAGVVKKLKPLEDKSVKSEDEKEEIKQLRKKEQQLRTEKEQLRTEKEQLRTEKEQLREKELILLKQRNGIPLLGDLNSMYDIWGRLSAKSSSTSGKYATPSFHATRDECPLSELLTVPSLSPEAFQAVLREPNQLWKSTFMGVEKAVTIGSTEMVVDDYVAKVIMSVANALRLHIRLEQQTWINGIKADHWVVKVLNETVAILVGSEESKLPLEVFGPPFVLSDVRFLVQLRRQLLEVHSYYGTAPVYGIGSTGREWCFFKLPSELDVEPKTPIRGESRNEVTTPSWGPKSSPRKSNRSPPTTSIGPDNLHEPEGEYSGEEGQIQMQAAPGLLSTKVYKWDDPEMLRTLGGVLKAMCESARVEVSVVSSETLSSRLMWFLLRREDLQPWGWASLSVDALHWRSTMRISTSQVVVLCCLGHGADGKALLVANQFGEIGVLKLLVPKDWGRGISGRSGNAEFENVPAQKLDSAWETAQKEAENWRTVYQGCVWAGTVRAEKWMGLPSVVMPRFNQFTTQEDRKNGLEAVRRCLEDNFVKRGYVHEDVAWRNVGYFKKGNQVIVVMLDLCPARVKKQKESDFREDWVNAAIESLKTRCSL